MIEKQIEAKGVKYAKSRGIEPYKFTSPSHFAVPDRIFLTAIPEEHRAIVAKYLRFVEVKREGGKATPAQVREHERLRKMGFTVHIADSVAGIMMICDSMGADNADA